MATASSLELAPDANNKSTISLGNVELEGIRLFDLPVTLRRFCQQYTLNADHESGPPTESGETICASLVKFADDLSRSMKAALQDILKSKLSTELAARFLDSITLIEERLHSEERKIKTPQNSIGYFIGSGQCSDARSHDLISFLNAQAIVIEEIAYRILVEYLIQRHPDEWSRWSDRSSQLWVVELPALGIHKGEGSTQDPPDAPGCPKEKTILPRNAPRLIIPTTKKLAGKMGGRPRDKQRPRMMERVRQLKIEGKDWSEITEAIKEEFHRQLGKDTLERYYRRYVNK
jgi:hypothetical protein